MQGKIIKGIAGFYYVHAGESGVYECKAKGIFRNQKIKPLVGDNVRMTILDDRDREGNIEEIASSFYAVPKTVTPDIPLPRYFRAEKNPYGITYVKLAVLNEDFVFAVSDGLSLTNVRCGNGRWIDNRVSVEMLMAPNAPDYPVQTSERTAGIAAAYTNDGGVIRAELRCRYSPHHLTLTFSPTDAGMTMTFEGLRMPKGVKNTLELFEV